jgi:Ca2+-binding RTX toxin-like protein
MISRRVGPPRAGAGESSIIETLEKRVCLSGFAPVFDPSGFTATATSSKSVRLDWTDNSVNERGFLIERSTDGLAWHVVVSAPRNSHSFNDASVDPSTNYFYRITAQSNAARSKTIYLADNDGLDDIDFGYVTTPPPTADLFASLSGGDLSVYGTEGNDVISLSLDSSNIVANLNGEELSFAAAAVTRIHVFGLPGDDRIVVNAGISDTNLNGGDGNDVIVGGSGDDRIDGGGGNDVIRGLVGDDTLLGGIGKDTLWGGNGDDFLDGGAGNDVLRGEDGNDNLFGGNGLDRLYGGLGIDSLVGGHGADVLNP